MVKLSSHTVFKIVRLYLLGKSETDIAKTLGIDQSTVSKHKAKFEALAQNKGMKEAAEQYGVAEEVEELHSLSAEMYAGHLTVKEANAGNKMVQKFMENGVPQEDYTDCIKALKRMKDEGFIAAAIKLKQLEDSSGISCHEIVSQAASSYKQLEKIHQELQTYGSKLEVAKLELTNIMKQKTTASEDLKEHLQKVGADIHRLELVEDLAVALKEAGVTNDDIDMYIQRQNLLNKAVITIDIFAQILNAAKVPTASDGGKGFLNKLIEYGGLEGTVTSLKQQEQVLTLNVSDLKAKAKLKGKFEAETLELETRKAALEITVSKFDAQKQKTADEVKALQAERESLAQQILTLKYDISEKLKLDASLDESIHTKQKNVADLDQLELKRDAFSSEVAGLEARAVKEKGRLDVSDAVMALVQSVPLAGLEALQESFPQLLEAAKVGQSYSPKVLRDHMLRELTGGRLQVLRCSSCGMRFTVDKPADSGGYHCPKCMYSSQVEVDENETEIIKTALEESKRGSLVITVITPPKNYPVK